MARFSNRHPQVSSRPQLTGNRNPKQNAVRKSPRRGAAGRHAVLRDEIRGWLDIVVHGAVAALFVACVLAVVMAMVRGDLPVAGALSVVGTALGDLHAARF